MAWQGKDKLLHFEITIRPDEGTYKCALAASARAPTRFAASSCKPPVAQCHHSCTCLGCLRRGGAFTFSFNISTSYPHDAPKVKCRTKARRMHGACAHGSLHLGAHWQLSGISDDPTCIIYRLRDMRTDGYLLRAPRCTTPTLT